MPYFNQSPRHAKSDKDSKHAGISAALAGIAFAVTGCTAADNSTANDTVNNDLETVVLLHGFGRSAFALRALAGRIENAGFNTVRVDYDSLNSTPEEIIVTVSEQIDACCLELTKPLHFVGHSLGGLIIRAYLDEQSVDLLGRVVLIATPNAGTPLVDAYQDSWWMTFAGPTARELGTTADSFPNSLPAPDYPVGVIAGTWESNFTEDLIPGADDGLVPIDSAKIDGMSDFIMIESNHSHLRYSEEVADQTVAFLKTGHFNRSADFSNSADLPKQ